MISPPTGDVWMLKDTDSESQHYGKFFKFDFSYITSDEIKTVVRDYVWMNYRTGNCTLNKLYGDISNFKHFNSFAETMNVKSFVSLTNADISDFISYLRTKISQKTNRPFLYHSQKNYLDTLKSIIYWGSIHKPAYVPSKQIFTGNEYRGVNSKLKIDFIPDDVLSQINEALIVEENPYIKYGIIILQCTGMRIGDLLNLTISCIQPHPISGYTISWFDYKSRKLRPPNAGQE